jgi:hypothetical protein
MKKSIILLLSLTLMCSTIVSQTAPIKFNKFKLSWFNVMGFTGGGGGQTLTINFQNLSGKEFKYVTIHYYPINAVNDITKDNYNRSDLSVNCTGPFKPNVIYKRCVDIALFYPILLTSYPYLVNITYMDDTEQEIIINDDNITVLFPNIKPIKINNL